MATKELDVGVHEFSIESFIESYCLTMDHGDNERWYFARPLQQIYNWASSAGASYILIGGSFVSSRKNPSDVDLLVVFKNIRNIQKCPESLLIHEVAVDIQYLCEEESSLLEAFIYLLAHSKSGVEKGIARIALSANQPKLEVPTLQPVLYEIVRDVYEGRTQLLPYNRKGIIIPIHGVNTNARWINYFSLLASNAGWGIAPFVYGREWVTTLTRRGRREQLAESFRLWLNKVRTHYDGPIGIFSHSLGTYIFAKYLDLTHESNENFCGLILAGSILNTNLDWSKYLNEGRLSAVCNTYSTRDTWVKKMPDGGLCFHKDPLYGNAGQAGFQNKHKRLIQYKSDILNHVNMFEYDEIKRWLDFFEISLKLHTTTPEIRNSINLEHLLKKSS